MQIEVGEIFIDFNFEIHPLVLALGPASFLLHTEMLNLKEFLAACEVHGPLGFASTHEGADPDQNELERSRLGD